MTPNWYRNDEKNLFFSLCLCAVTAPSLALDVPNQSQLDSNIQHTRYNAEDVVSITAYIGMASHIVLDADETVVAKHVGFQDGWSVDVEKNNLFIKPIAVKGQTVNAKGEPVERVVQPNPAQWKTNFLLVTNKRNYTFLLTVGTGTRGTRQNTFRLTFNYPLPTPTKQTVAATQQKTSLEKAREKPVQPKNWDYLMQVGKKSTQIAPIKAFDDGRFTYMTFAQNSEIPAIFIVDENDDETLVNSHVNPRDPNTLVVQRIARQWVLRLNQSVVGVTNQRFNTVRVNNQTGSTLQGVERQVTQ